MSNLDALTDVVITNPQNEQRLVYEDGIWVNKTIEPDVEPWVRPDDWLAIEQVGEEEEKFIGLKAIFEEDNFIALSAGTLPSSIQSNGSTTDGTSFTIASSSYQAGVLYVLSITNSVSSGSAAIPTSITGGAGAPSFSQVETTLFNSNLNRVTVYTAVPTESYTGTLAISFDSTQTGAVWNIFAVPTALTSVNQGIVQVSVSVGSSETPNTSLSSFGNSINSTFAVVATTSSSVTSGEGFTQFGNTAISTPTLRLSAEWKYDNNTTPWFAITSAPWAVVALEIAMDPLVTVDWGDGSSGTFSCFADKSYNYANISNNTITSKGYKQVIVTVTPVSGKNLSRLDINRRHSAPRLQAYETGWLDIEVGSPNFTSNGLVISSNSDVVSIRLLERIRIANLGGVTDMTNMFFGASALRSVILLNTSSVINMNGLFSGCISLTTVPLFNTASVTSMESMFNGCINLTSVPLYNTASVTSMVNMFTGCTLLNSVPLFNTANVTSMSFMFSSCNSITSVPLFNTASVTNMSGVLNFCRNLVSVPLFNTANVTNMSSMFSTCSSITSVPQFNTANVTNMSSMLNNCAYITEVPLFNTVAVTNMSSMFSGCRVLYTVPALNVANVTSFSSVFDTCRSLSKADLTNISSSISFLNCLLSMEELGNIFSNLNRVTTTATITVAGNIGADVAQTRTVTTTAQSNTVSTTNTFGIDIGDFVTGVGTGITTGVSVSSDVDANTLTLNNHGLANGTRIAFSALGTTTGVLIWNIYYVVSTTQNTFQIAITENGDPIDLTGTNSTMTLRYPSYVLSIDPNVSVTLSTPLATTGSGRVLSFRTLNAAIPLLQNWSVSF
jgi:surface protein